MTQILFRFDWNADVNSYVSDRIKKKVNAVFKFAFAIFV